MKCSHCGKEIGGEKSFRQAWKALGLGAKVLWVTIICAMLALGCWGWTFVPE